MANLTRCRLLEMTEVKREEELAQRSELKARVQEKRLLAQMVKQQKSAGMGNSLDEDSVARAAKRKRPPAYTWHDPVNHPHRPTYGARSDQGEIEEARRAQGAEKGQG